MALQVEPELRAVAEVEAEPERRVGGDAAAAVDDLGDAVWRNADRTREPVLGQAVLGEELLLQHLAGGNGRELVLRHGRLPR